MVFQHIRSLGRTGDRKGNAGQAVKGLAIPGKALVDHPDPLGTAVPLAHQNRAGFQFRSPLVELGRQGIGVHLGATCGNLLQQSNGCDVEVAQRVGLQPIGQRPE
jgi:hypothetical protein